jgi:iron complex outermembrane receptor protein
MIASRSERNPLFGSDREITASADYRRFGGPNLGSPFYGVPATILSVAGNLPGLNSSFAAVPTGSTGVGLQPADFAATAGVQNLGSFTSYQSLVPSATRTGLFLNAEYRLRGGTKLFAELLASEYEGHVTTAPATLLQVSVPATNAFNPFGTAVRASGVVRGAEPLGRLLLRDDLVRPLVGARGELGAWEWETTALSSRDHGLQASTGQANAAQLSAALVSADARTALNPFVDGPMASPDVLASIFGAVTETPSKANATVLNGFVRRSLSALPAGTLDLVLGSEYERGELERGTTDAERSARAVFAELRAPLLAGGDERRELLTLQGAARYDDFSDFGTENTWQLGVVFRPHEAVLLRATRATAFKPPTLYNLGAPITTNAIPVTDPRRNSETVVIQSISGGNAQLDPTTSESSALGVVWSADRVSGVDVSFTAWTLRIDRAINLPDAQYIINNESLYPGRVVRAPSDGSIGPIISADRTYINFGSIDQQGYDVSVAWSVRTGAGELTPAIAATYMTEFEGASAPGGANVDRLSRANSDGIFAPQAKATASVGWRPSAALKVSLSGRYVGRYYDYTPTRKLGDIWYIDAGVGFALGARPGNDRGALEGLNLSVVGTNLADKLPPYSTHFRGYDIYNYDLIGRTILVRLEKEF